MPERCTIAFIGLGTMGAPIARHLAAAGHNLIVFNRTELKASNWIRQHIGKVATSPCDAVSHADFVFTCVRDDDAVRDVLLGNNAFASARPGTMFIDHTTTSVATARDLCQQAEQLGISFLDAPVSGGQAGAEKGVLTIMVGGPEKAFVQAEPLLRCHGKSIHYLGPGGSGQAAKMVNQILIAGIIQSLAEGLRLAERLALDLPKLMDVLMQGTGRSWQMEQRALNMISRRFNYGFAAELLRKDLLIGIAEANRVGGKLPVTAQVADLLAVLDERGSGKLDHSSLITLL